MSDDATPDDEAEYNTETVEIELDPARSVMYRMASDAGGPVVEEFLRDKVTDAVEQAYDNREEFRDAYEQQAAERAVDPLTGE